MQFSREKRTAAILGMLVACLAGLWTLVLRESACLADEPLPRVPPTEPMNTLASFQIEPGFGLELLAAEPMVHDPVAMVYDEQGRAFVAEMKDYPFVDQANDKAFTENVADKALGQIRLLEDIDGDGKFDKSTIFADQLSWPTGLAAWKGGLFVVATPDLWYLKDNDGDGKADERRRVYSGFRKFNVQTVTNNLKWGLDHKLYGAGSSNGGKIISGLDVNKPAILMGTGDFRFNPIDDVSSFELLTGGARFGNDFDDWGNRFICNIRNPIQHPVLPRHYLARNPYLPAIAPLHDVAISGDVVPVYRTSPPEPWRVLNANRLANDFSVASPRSEAAATGYMTSACGLTIYRGDAYPESFYGTVFLGEVAGNLIHHQTLAADSVTFTSKRTHTQREFLSSTDNWFRPVNFVNAPDGTLHVLDMYRETIEHPWSIPDDIKARVDLRSGTDRGRIYRLAPVGFQSRITKPQLHRATTLELVETLSHPSSWWRDTAHRLLYERQDIAAVEPLRMNLRARSPKTIVGRDVSALSRLHSLWSLAGMDQLEDESLTLALRDPIAGVREHAVQLSEDRLVSSQFIRNEVQALARVEIDNRVRMQLAFSLGTLSNGSDERLRQGAIEPLAAIALANPEDRWLRMAVLSSSTSIAPLLLGKLLEDVSFSDSASNRIWLNDLAVIVGARANSDEIKAFLGALVTWSRNHSDHDAAQDGLIQATLGFAEGLARAKQKLSDVLKQKDAQEVELIQQTLARAASLATDRKLGVSVRTSAIGLLKHVEYPVAKQVAQSLLVEDELAAVQSAVVRMLATHRLDEVPSFLVSVVRRLSSPARAETIEALLARREWHPALIDAMENSTIRVGEIPYLRRNLLLRSTSPNVKERASQLMQSVLKSRQDVVERYRREIEKTAGQASQGLVVFKRECQNCHRLEGEGEDIGPNLTTIRNRTPPEILLHILDPNREVPPNYISYSILMDDGRSLAGLVVDEGVSSLTIRTSAGALETVARADVEQISSTGLSLMPTGLEERIDTTEMSHLLAYLLNKP